MLVYSGNVHCLVAQATQNELWALWRILTVRVNTRQDYEEIPFWSTMPDGHTLFLAGFTKYVDKEMRALGFFIHYVDQRTMPTFECAYPEAHSTFEPYIDQAEQVEHMLKQTRGVLHLATNYGKALGRDCPVLTPSGWVPIRDIKPGNFVVGSDGNPTVVAGVYPQGVRKLSRVSFSDGASVICDDDHLWFTTSHDEQSKHKPGSTKTTSEIRSTLTRKIPSGVRYMHRVPLVGPVCLDPAEELPLDPRLLGLLLGDGYLSRTSVKLSNSEPDIIEYVRNTLLPGDTLVFRGRVDHGINGGATKKALGGLGLLGCLSYTKFIPEVYLKAPVAARVELLRGLMDSDGYIPANSCRVEYSTSSPRLSRDVTELVRSLGGFVNCSEKVPYYTYKGERKRGRLSYRMSVYSPNFTPVSSSKHMTRWVDGKRESYRNIVDVERVPDGEAVCISVAARDGLFVVKDYVVTHNTYLMSHFWARTNRSPMLVVVPTKALLRQTSKDLEDQAGLPEGSVGRVGDGMCDWKPTTVAVINSLDAWLDKHGSLPIQTDSLFVDEGHRGVGDMHARVAQHMDSFYRFWMSGTAYKPGDAAHEFRLTGLAGSCIGRITNKQLVDWGRSKEPIIRFIDHQMEHRVDLEDDDFHGQYNLLVEDELRNQTIVNTAREAVSIGLTILIFVEHTRHQRLLENMGMRDWCSFVQGGNNTRNERIKKQLKRGEISCACATSAWREGVSIGNLDALFQGGGKKAWTAKGQDFGRVLRQSELGFGWFFDFYDHGPPMLSRHSQSRMDSLREEGFDVTIVRDTQNLFSRRIPEGSTDELGQPRAGSTHARRLTHDG